MRLLGWNWLYPLDLAKSQFTTIGPSDRILGVAREVIKQTGTIEYPISVSKGVGGILTIIDGHHRWRAAIQMGLSKIPIKIIEWVK